MARRASSIDFFAKARRAGAAMIVLAALLAIAGSFADWVRITPPPHVPPDQVSQTLPFTGVEARDGWLVVGVSGFLLLCALGVVARAKSFYGWLAFFASILIGSIAFADIRGLRDLDSAISRRMDIVGEAKPAIGLIVVAAAGLIGFVGSLVAIAGSPDRREGES